VVATVRYTVTALIVPQIRLETTSHPSLADSAQIWLIALERVQHDHEGYPEAESRQHVVLYRTAHIIVKHILFIRSACL
jgi:hypothetical protein